MEKEEGQDLVELEKDKELEAEGLDDRSLKESRFKLIGY